MSLPLLPVLALSCGGLSVPSPTAVLAPDDSGLLVLLPASQGLLDAQAEAPIQLQWRASGGAWARAVGPAGEAATAGARYWLPADRFGGAALADLELRLVAGDAASALAAPQPSTLAVSTGALSSPLVSTDALALELAPDLATLAGVAGLREIEIDERGIDGDRAGWLSAALCPEGALLGSCLAAQRQVEAVDDIAAAQVLPAVVLEHDTPLELAVVASLWVDAIDPDGRPARALVARGTTAEPLYSTGRRLSWGDLHAHGNLSPDGCEEPSADCGPGEGGASADFFEQARAAGLDFAALTEHAEWGTYYAEGLSGAAYADTWSTQQALAQDADGDGLVALVGYEWTRQADPAAGGGHKVVLLEALDAPAALRVSAPGQAQTATKDSGEAYRAGSNALAEDGAALLDAMLDAEAEVGPAEWLSFWAHPAVEAAQAVDLAYAPSLPDQRFERLIEIYSERGSSECLDPAAADCGLGVDPGGYLSSGSVQAALSAGLRLGFVANTDAHDARPGSVDDGPSSRWVDESGAAEPQLTSGGITGVWAAGALDRAALLDALYDRATLASTGPRPAGRVLGIDDAGHPWLPGQVLPASGSLRVLARLDADGYTTSRVSLVAADGTVVASADGPVLDHTLALQPGGAWYLRAVLSDGTDEHRLWVSPFFTESAP